MMAEKNELSTIVRGWRLTTARHNDCRIYYHAGRNELAWEDPQTARLIALPPDAERKVREEWRP